uniref:C-type lectin domain-containing protein n=1 Tax=Erpetoichthys calabaricus TaxID=27687 RepID=A0A8C4RNW9_ERPCA
VVRNAFPILILHFLFTLSLSSMLKIQDINYNLQGFNPQLFYISNVLMSWMDAQDYCRRHFTDLAILPSNAKDVRQQFLKLSLNTFWVGLSHPASMWIWANGSQLQDADWAPGEPSNVGPDERKSHPGMTEWKSPSWVCLVFTHVGKSFLTCVPNT